MTEKILNTRIVHKHDTAVNWDNKNEFIPNQGEIIIYDIDENYNYERMKIGDGVTDVCSLPFVDDNVINLIDGLAGEKKEKDLIITYTGADNYSVTHSAADVAEAINEGRTVFFKKDGELLSVLESSTDYAVFYIFYVNMNNKIQQKIVAIDRYSKIMLEQDDIYDYATKSNLNSYYTKTATDAMLNDYYKKTDLAPMTNADIDAICV